MEQSELSLLRENHAGALVLVDGRTINYGVIRNDGRKLLFYTGKGLREIWSPHMDDTQQIHAEILKHKPEAELRQSGHIDEIDLDEIRRVLF